MTARLVYVLNGPNLNLLGTREPEIYGSQTLDDIGAMIAERAQTLGLEIDMRQSNHEGHLVDWLHEAQSAGAAAVLLNAGAFTHPSVREDFRHQSYIGMAAMGTVAGFGGRSYVVALEAAAGL